MCLRHWVTYINVGLETKVRKALQMARVLFGCGYIADKLLTLPRLSPYELHQILPFSSLSLSTEH